MAPLFGLLVLTLIALASASPAAAHAFLVQTTPQAGERLTASPPLVALRFSEPVVSAELTVARADGGAVDQEGTRRAQAGLRVEAALPELDDGIYVVAYEVVADDTHVTAGEFAFAVGDVDDGALANADGEAAEAQLSWPQVLARWLLVAGLAIAIGGLVSERVLWRGVAPAGTILPLLPAAGLIALAALGATGSLIALLVLADASDLTARLQSVPALALGAQLVLLAIAAQLLWLPGLRGWSLLPLAAALGAASLSAHPGSQGIGPATASLVHLGGVAVWIGGLLHVALVVWRFRAAPDPGWLRRGLARYATAALVMVGMVLVSGTVLAIAQLERPAELLETAYGRFLVAKLALVGVALGLALLARLRGLGRGRPLRVRLLSRVTRLEALALVGALALASVVGGITPPTAVRGADHLLGPPPLDGPVLRAAGLAGSMAVHLAAAPGRLELRALDFSGDGIVGAQLRVSGQRPDGAGLDLRPRDCGAGCWTTALSWPQGTTTLSVEVSAPDWRPGALEFELPWPPQSGGERRLDQVIAAMRSVPEVVMTEHVTSGPGMSGRPQTFRQPGAEFIARELYAAGGGTDIHPVPPVVGESALTLYLPGSAIWLRLELDEDDRIVAETIVSPGHLIERTFSYPSGSGAWDGSLGGRSPRSSSSVWSIASGGSSPAISRTTVPSAPTK